MQRNETESTGSVETTQMRNLANAKLAFAVIEHHVMFHRDHAKQWGNGSVSTVGRDQIHIRILSLHTRSVVAIRQKSSYITAIHGSARSIRYDRPFDFKP